MIDKKELRRLSMRFKACGPIFIALGDEIRQKLILDIGNAGTEGVNVNALASNSHLSRPAISHHLKILKDAGLISAQKNGTQVFYKLSLNKNVEHMEKLLSSMQTVLMSLEKSGQAESV